MIEVNASYQILKLPSEEDLKLIELAARTCYKSEHKITQDSWKELVSKLIELGHESVLEHSLITVKFICDRGISHELVRHRLASYSQESTRYCNYSKNRFHNQITVIKPFYLSGKQYKVWKQCMLECEKTYFKLLELGCKPEEARAVLPNSLKTEIVVSANIREWRHILRLRTSKRAHPQMRELMIPLLQELKEKVPVVFDDIILDGKAQL